MTERELLELAAKAAGYDVRSDGEGGLTITVKRGLCRGWNPLNDDGDALRLAGHLDLIVDFSRFAAIEADRFYQGHRDFALGNNVREAITRAAASICKDIQ